MVGYYKRSYTHSKQNDKGEAIEKPSNVWDDHDWELLSLNSRTMNILYYGRDADNFTKTSTCENAKDIWQTLKVVHKGTSHAKDSKINLIVHKYELFKMNYYESISDMFTR